jgi:hypothetical protein
MVVSHWYGGSKRTIFEVAAPEIRKEQTVKICDPLHGGQRRFYLTNH